MGQARRTARIVVAGKNSDTVPVGTLSSIRGRAVWSIADDGGWGAYLPDLPGVVAIGGSREEVADRIREALDAYAEEMSALGQPLPTPVAAAETIEAA